MNYIIEPEKPVPVIAATDLCVVGGSCTGVFAAVRAARLGLNVILVERQNMLGGTAVSGLVNIWHSLHDTQNRQQIISGLTEETLGRLRQRNALIETQNCDSSYNFSPWELAFILDEFVKENKIQIMLHTTYSGVHFEGRQVHAIFVENADGRGAIRTRFLIDATGDGRIARDLGIPSYVHAHIQPPSSCFHLMGKLDNRALGELVQQHGEEFGLTDDWGWSTTVPGCEGITLRADNHVFQVRCDRAADLTDAEIEGRRLAKAFLSLIQKYGNPDTQYAITALCSSIGIRETVHFQTKFRANARELLLGKRYDNPILNGSYRVDIHHAQDNGITFRYLDGRELTLYGKNTRSILGNWREKEALVGEPATFYQVPFEILVGEYENFIAVGRMLNADEGAFGALRVMVNLNQLGEAAGVAAYLCLHQQKPLPALSGQDVPALLRAGGSAL